MKIAFDSNVFCFQQYGGVSRYIVELARHLDGHGNEVKIFAPVHCNRYLPELPGKLVRGIQVKRYPPKTSGMFLALNQMLSGRAIRSWRPDIVHETYFADVRVKYRGKVVVTVYDMIHELFPEYFPATDKTSRLKKLTVERADHVICISRNTRQDLIERFGVPPEKTSVVYLGMDSFPAAEASLPPAVPTPYLLYVGVRRGYKNFSRLLEAFARSARLRQDFHLVAFGGGAFSGEELAQIEKAGLDARQVIQISGHDRLLQALYRHARLFVYPSIYEGFGIPPLEAFAHSCPVISSNTSSMPEVIGDAAEFFNPLNVEELTAALEKVAYNDELRDGLIRKGKARREFFSWDKCARETGAIYQALLA